MSTSISTLFVVVRIDNDIGQIRAILEALQPIMLSFFGEDKEHGDTSNIVLGYGYG